MKIIDIAFNDSHRVFKFILSGLCLTLLFWYFIENRPATSPSIRFLYYPDFHDGKWFRSDIMHVQHIFDDGLTITYPGWQGPLTLKVITKDRNLLNSVSPGTQITVTGIFHKNGTLTLHSYNINRGRSIKILISIIALCILFFYLISNYKLSRSSSEFGISERK